MSLIGKLKDDSLLIKGEVDERAPILANNLVNHYTFDSVDGDNLLSDFSDTRAHPGGDKSWTLNHKVYAGQTYTVGGFFKRSSVHDGRIYCMFDLRMSDGTLVDGTMGLVTGWSGIAAEPLYYYFHNDIKSATTDYVFWSREIKIPEECDGGELRWVRFTWADTPTLTDTTSIKLPNFSLKGHNRLPLLVNNNTVESYDSIFVGEAHQNFVLNGCFQDGLGIDSESGSTGNNSIIKDYSNPMRHISNYVLRQDAGVSTEYEIHPQSGVSLAASTKYRLIAWTYHSPDFDGDKQTHHARAYSSSGAHNATAGSGTLIDIWEGWERRYIDITTPSDYNGTFNWYIGYPTKGTKGYRLVTGVQIVKADDGFPVWTNDSLGTGQLAMPNSFSKNGGSIAFSAKRTNEQNTLSYKSLIANVWTDNGFFIFTDKNSNGELYFYYPQVGATHKHVNTDFVPPINKWVNYIWTWDSNSITLYANGVKIGESTTGDVDCSRIVSTIDKMYIGSHPNSSYQSYGEFRNLSVYGKKLTEDEVRKFFNTSMSLSPNGFLITPKLQEKQDFLRRDMDSYIHFDGQFANGWSKYLQSKVTVTTSTATSNSDSNYSMFLHRPPNLDYSIDGNVMWGGALVWPSQTVKKAGKWKLSFYYKGHIAPNNLDVYFAYNIGWISNGVGLTSPASKSEPAFSTDEWKKYELIYDLTDADIYQTGTDGKIYDCMRQLKIGFGYEDTDSIGTRVFIDKVCIEPVDSEQAGMKEGKIYFNELIEMNNMNNFYVQGTSYLDGGVDTSGNCVFKANGKDIFNLNATTDRGLTLAILDIDTNILFTQTYDTYGSDTDRTALSNKLSTIKANQYWALASFDAHNTNVTLTTQMNSMGSKIFEAISGNRCTYAALGKGQNLIQEDGSAATAFDKHRAIITKYA